MTAEPLEVPAREAPVAPLPLPLLVDRTIVVTGASGGIGTAISWTLAAAGARLVLLDLAQETVDDLARQLHSQGTSALAAAVDVTDRACVSEVLENAMAAFGPLDGLVNCAGLWAPRPWGEISDDAWAETIDANLRSAFVCCRAALDGMVARRRGAIVNFASTAGEYGSISPALHYAAAKGGVIALTKSLAREVGRFNVRVNAISPGPVDTAALGATTAEQKAQIGERTLLGRMGQPQEIANGVLYLLSPLASFVTGHVLRVNGGSLL